MPSREETAFGAVLVMATIVRRSQWSTGASGSANESTPSARSPRCHSTKPPKIERAADPEPRLASAESPDGSSARPAARLAASASADEVEEAHDPPRLLAGGVHPIDHEAIGLAAAEADRCLRPEPVEGERDAARGREVQRRVALAPVLDQGDVHVGASGRVGADHLGGGLL